jgi:hypothetical protein
MELNHPRRRTSWTSDAAGWCLGSEAVFYDADDGGGGGGKRETKKKGIKYAKMLRSRLRVSGDMRQASMIRSAHRDHAHRSRFGKT